MALQRHFETVRNLEPPQPLVQRMDEVRPRSFQASSFDVKGYPARCGPRQVKALLQRDDQAMQDGFKELSAVIYRNLQPLQALLQRMDEAWMVGHLRIQLFKAS